MHLKPYPKFQKELKLESIAEGMCDDADGQLDIWAVIKPGNTKKKIGIFTGQQCGQSSAQANLSTEGIRADVGPANPRMVSMKAKGCWEVEESTATHRKRSAEPDKRCCPERLSQGGGEAQQEAWEVEGEGKTLSVVEMVAYLEQRANKPRVVFTKPLPQHSHANLPESQREFPTMHLKPYPKFQKELKLESIAEGMCDDADGQLDIWAVIKPVNTKKKIGIFTGQQCGQSSAQANLSTEGIRADVGPANPRMVSMKAKGCWEVEESTATHRKGSAEPDKRCCPERLSQGGGEAQQEAWEVEGEGKTLSVVEMVAYLEQRANKPRVVFTKPLPQHSHANLPESQREFPTMHLKPYPKFQKELKLESIAEGMCDDADGQLDIWAVIKPGNTKKKIGIFTGQQCGQSSAQANLSTEGIRADVGPANPRMVSMKAKGCWEVEESTATHRKRSAEPDKRCCPERLSQGGGEAQQEAWEVEGEGKTLSVVEMVAYLEQRANKPRVVFTKPLPQHSHANLPESQREFPTMHLKPYPKFQKELKLESIAEGMCDDADGQLDIWAVIKPGNTKKKIGIFTGQQCGQSSAQANLSTEGIRADVGPANPRMVSMKAKGCWEVEESTATHRKGSAEPDKRCCPERLSQGGGEAQQEAWEVEGEGKTLSVVEMVAYLEQRANKPRVVFTKPLPQHSHANLPESQREFPTMHLKPYPKFQKELKLESIAEGMCDDADGQLDIWAVIKPGNTKKKIGIFTGQQCGQSSAQANLSTEGIRADVGPANPRMVSMKAKGCWEVEESTATHRKRSAEPDKRCCPERLSQGGGEAQQEAWEVEGEGKTLSVVEMVAYLEQRANKPRVVFTKPLPQHSHANLPESQRE